MIHPRLWTHREGIIIIINAPFRTVTHVRIRVHTRARARTHLATSRIPQKQEKREEKREEKKRKKERKKKSRPRRTETENRYPRASPDTRNRFGARGDFMTGSYTPPGGNSPHMKLTKHAVMPIFPFDRRGAERGSLGVAFARGDDTSRRWGNVLSAAVPFIFTRRLRPYITVLFIWVL